MEMYLQLLKMAVVVLFEKCALINIVIQDFFEFDPQLTDSRVISSFNSIVRGAIYKHDNLFSDPQEYLVAVILKLSIFNEELFTVEDYSYVFNPDF